MKIGITCYPTYGGSGAVATELGLELARRGHEVHFITYDSPFRLRGYVEHAVFHQVDTTMSRYPLFDHYPYTLALASRQYEVALEEQLDLLHVHYAIPHATTAYLAREMLRGKHKLKVITTLHGTDITLVGQESSFFAISRFSIEQSDGVTAVSEFLRDETYRAFGCVQCDLRVVPNFVNLEEYRPEAALAHETLAPAGHKLLVHVSNFREVKRVKDVVRIFARVRRMIPATLLMVGDGPDRHDAEAEARELGVGADVRFLGRLDAVAPVLAAADLFVLPSQTESFGLAALEAMACGAPVLAARTGGLPEVITDGVDGILEPPGSVEAMARRALNLLRDAPAHAAMRSAALQRAATFSAAAVVPQYEAFYEEILAR
ncbi:MAG: N-acetyl-alpha-D-glucosaminyl L-malate synthase BshA [Gemmatimonadetes bacterium]|nr:N-acetyl-alpha-D-glucosaminyl L-malate synthase BshA [Gemmatimonadota bacterium]HPF62825.1 N-acetyl-alpha-D-glucosaminyl L-malate synthase BshA [Gemmatimonadales bacterium]HRX19728.1 N-acetyl-alpha-D-glucosaminyl L-malate synthase BshA [Gemmatimonadales bacterium]